MTLDSRILSSIGASDRQIDNLVTDYRIADLSAADLASLRFCLKLTRHAPSVSSRNIEALRACGFEDATILEAVVVTALALYRCTLSFGLGPEPDFGARKPALTRNDPAVGVAPQRLSLDPHEAAQRKGPYVPAPYMSSKAFAPFAVVQTSHGFIPNFFRAQTLRLDLLEAELEAVGRILLAEDVLTRSGLPTRNPTFCLMINLKVDAVFDSIQSDPRSRDLVRRVGIPQ